MMSSRVELRSLCFSLLFFSAINSGFAAAWATTAPLKVGYYRHRCPSAEAVVKHVVAKAFANNAGTAPGLVRMHFHDCFVRGCDASVLLDSTTGNPSEKSAVPNSNLRGFEVIDQAKEAVESICPGTVSCADVLAFAARDAAYLAGGIKYSVPSGRRDGRISMSSEALDNLPSPFSDANQLKDSFARKGLSLDDMVTLSGAHSFGRSQCAAITSRLYSFNDTHPQDPTMDWAFAAYLKTRCPPPPATTAGDPTVDLDIVTPHRLDNQYYKNLVQHKGLLTSDQTLQTSSLTARMVAGNANRPGLWSAKFAAAMVKMGSVQVLTGSQGEIRNKCRVVNYH